jgi:hypothetical protein
MDIVSSRAVLTIQLSNLFSSIADSWKSNLSEDEGVCPEVSRMVEDGAQTEVYATGAVIIAGCDHG